LLPEYKVGEWIGNLQYIRFSRFQGTIPYMFRGTIPNIIVLI
jgi:hypothetical protein